MKIENEINNRGLQIEFDKLCFSIGDTILEGKEKENYFLTLVQSDTPYEKMNNITTLLFQLETYKSKKILELFVDFNNTYSIKDKENVIKEISDRGLYNALFHNTDPNLLYNHMEFLNQDHHFSWVDFSLFACDKNFPKKILPNVSNNLLQELKNKQKKDSSIESLVYQFINNDSENAYYLLYEFFKNQDSAPYIKPIFVSLMVNETVRQNKQFWDFLMFLGDQFKSNSPEEFKKTIQESSDLGWSRDTKEAIYKNVGKLGRLLWHGNWFLTVALFKKDLHYQAKSHADLKKEDVYNIQKIILHWGEVTIGKKELKNYLEKMILFSKDKSLCLAFANIYENIDFFKSYMENTTLKEEYKNEKQNLILKL